ncbi:peptidase family m48 domain-containing protein [Ditylenchus destructor]|uniref:CAAX prenyl protease n=1 Tax=Ditylenchus destructor TaxID=166010 RepID=A0AAD4N179_9BILA|nr:peptidase family m48 domain-containing protein [Ditylenchus destructor]
MSPDAIFWSLISFYWVSFVWDLYVAFRQYKVHLNCAKRPDHVSEIISEEDYDKARRYKLDKHRFGFVQAIFGCLQTSIVFVFNILPEIWELTGNWSRFLGLHGEIWHSIMFLSCCTIAENIISLPFSFYDTFVIEQKHGFNKETVPFFFQDKAKKILVSLVITAPITAGVIWIVSVGGQYFFFYLWIFLCVVIFAMMTIYPEFIAPLFDKYTPLPASELKEKIEALARRVEFPLKKLYVVENSKRSSHSNAYMYGFWKNKRIVLYDTLLSQELNDQLTKLADEEKSKNGQKQSSGGESDTKSEEPNKDDTKKRFGMSDDEVVAVLGHELGHWKLFHSVGNLVIAELNILLLLAVFAYFYRQESLYAAFGFSSQPVIWHYLEIKNHLFFQIVIGFMIVFQFVTAPYNELVSIAMSFISRWAEFSADRFSAKLGYAGLMQSALIKIGKDNLSLPIDDPLYSMINHSHPPIPERIAALKKYV